MCIFLENFCKDTANFLKMAHLNYIFFTESAVIVDFRCFFQCFFTEMLQSPHPFQIQKENLTPSME